DLPSHRRGGRGPEPVERADISDGRRGADRAQRDRAGVQRQALSGSFERCPGMKLRFGDIFAQAGNLWRSESALLVPLAAIFFFLPVLAVLLVVPIVDLGGLEGEARAE